MARKGIVELADGTTIPIVRSSRVKRAYPWNTPTAEDADIREPTNDHGSRKVKVTKHVTLQPGTNTWVEVTTNTRGLVQIEPARRLFNTHMCLAGHEIAQVERNKPFRILVANFGKVARKLLPGQGIAQANSHPTRIYESLSLIHI